MSRPLWLLAYQIPLLLLHIFVFTLIVWQMAGKNTTFRASFYKLYLFQSLIDYCSMFFVSMISRI